MSAEDPRNLDHILRDDASRELLREFLQRSCTSECLEFIEMLSKLDLLVLRNVLPTCEGSIEEIVRLASEIVAKFLLDTSPLEINISAQMRRNILAYYERFMELRQSCCSPGDIIDHAVKLVLALQEAEMHIRHHLSEEQLPNFFNSKPWIDRCQSKDRGYMEREMNRRKAIRKRSRRFGSGHITANIASTSDAMPYTEEDFGTSCITHKDIELVYTICLSDVGQANWERIDFGEDHMHSTFYLDSLRGMCQGITPLESTPSSSVHIIKQTGILEEKVDDVMRMFLVQRNMCMCTAFLKSYKPIGFVSTQEGDLTSVLKRSCLSFPFPIGRLECNKVVTVTYNAGEREYMIIWKTCNSWATESEINLSSIQRKRGLGAILSGAKGSHSAKSSYAEIGGLLLSSVSDDKTFLRSVRIFNFHSVSEHKYEIKKRLLQGQQKSYKNILRILSRPARYLTEFRQSSKAQLHPVETPSWSTSLKRRMTRSNTLPTRRNSIIRNNTFISAITRTLSFRETHTTRTDTNMRSRGKNFLNEVLQTKYNRFL